MTQFWCHKRLFKSTSSECILMLKYFAVVDYREQGTCDPDNSLKGVLGRSVSEILLSTSLMTDREIWFMLPI